jgi:hypothetical protein
MVHVRANPMSIIFTAIPYSLFPIPYSLFPHHLPPGLRLAATLAHTQHRTQTTTTGDSECRVRWTE